MDVLIKILDNLVLVIRGLFQSTILMPVEPQLDRPDGKRNLEKFQDRNLAWLDLFYKDEKVSGVVSEAIEVSEVLDAEEEEGVLVLVLLRAPGRDQSATTLRVRPHLCPTIHSEGAVSSGA